MHVVMIIAALGLACWHRHTSYQLPGSLPRRWQQVLVQFLAPPLLLLTTALAVLSMGPKGQMIGLRTDWLSYCLALGFLGWAVVLWLKSAKLGWQSLQQVRSLPQICLINGQWQNGQWERVENCPGLTPTPESLASQGQLARLLDTPIPFIAQIGFWQPELVVSQGLLETLSSEHLEAVITHELAHHHYRDTFWFFWLGWIHRITAWLPNTESLWQELLNLREIRADHWAAKRVDALLLAESLLTMVSSPMITTENFCAPFSRPVPPSRFQERIDALLTEPESATGTSSWNYSWNWSWLLYVLLPLLVVPFHQ
ncbi:MAG: M48 family metalloprotease [Moorea sp. SIO3E2]|nr:M48 family metalloprotease [Moorena sp. SIO3E2]